MTYPSIRFGPSTTAKLDHSQVPILTPFTKLETSYIFSGSGGSFMSDDDAGANKYIAPDTKNKTQFW